MRTPLLLVATLLLAAALLLLAATAFAGDVVDPSTYVGNVYGTVTDASGKPIANASVGVFDLAAADNVMRCAGVSDSVGCIGSAIASFTVRSATTNPDGTFLINNVPAPDDGLDYAIAIAGATHGSAMIARVHVLPGAVMALELEARLDQRRTATPAVRWRYRHEIQMQPADGRSTGRARTDSYASRVFATREGLVGGTTANGHVITFNDHFVALPSRRALSTNFGHEREVRVTIGSRTVIAPVWDVGPWNTHDDYWNANEVRETFKDLPRGKPESQAAFLEGYNGGFDERGRKVLNPAGIDLADGTFRVDLALPDNAYVDVEYLWVDTAGPITSDVSAAPVAGSINVDATVSDATSGNSAITGAEVFVDEVGTDGSGYPASATDGGFDSPTESLHAVLSTSSWSPGSTHTIYAHGHDASGNWGPTSTTTASAPPVAGPQRRRSVRP